MTRINRVLEHMAKLQVDSVIIKDVTTIRYLTGFTGDSSLLYLDRQQGVLITDGQKRNEVLQGAGVYSYRCAQHLGCRR